MRDTRIGQVWESSLGYLYLVVGSVDLVHARNGWVWSMRALYEEGNLPPMRVIFLNEAHLIEHLVQVV